METYGKNYYSEEQQIKTLARAVLQISLKDSFKAQVG